MIDVKGLTKQYGKQIAVDGISFHINDNEVVGFLGANGAGKSTTMNMIAGCLTPSDGSIEIDGISMLDHPTEAKRKIGYLPEIPPLYMSMTVEEQLEFAFALKKGNRNRAEMLQQMDAVCEQTGITHVRKRMIKNLSKGYRQRIGIAQALMGDPDVLILDEPTVGLDPKQIIDIRSLISDIGKSHTVMLSSHILLEVSSVCDRVIILNQGKIVADGQPQTLGKSITYGELLQMRVIGDTQAIATIIENIHGVSSCRPEGIIEQGSFDYTVAYDPNNDVRAELAHTLDAQGYRILMMRPVELTLEEIFLHLA